MSASRAAVGLVVLVLGACGGTTPAVPHHGLRLTPLQDDAHGEAVRIGTETPLGRWVAELDTTWVRIRDGGDPEEGAAKLLLEQTIAREGGAPATTTLALEVRKASGVAEDLVGDLDGLRVSFVRGADGRPEPGSLRWERRAPRTAVLFLEDLGFAGYGLGVPWWPAREVAVGEAWARRELPAGGMGLPNPGTAGLQVRRLGGAKLVSADGTAVVQLETLNEVEGLTSGLAAVRAVSLGVLSSGKAAVDLATGLPSSWHFQSHMKYLDDDGHRKGSLELRQEVRGRVRVVEPSR